MMHGLKGFFDHFSDLEAPPSAEQIASVARHHLSADLNFSPFKTAKRATSSFTLFQGRPQPRNLFVEHSPKTQSRTELPVAVSKLADAQQRAVDLFELAETQRSSQDMQEVAKAEATNLRARMQQSVAKTLAKKVTLLEQSAAAHQSNPSVEHSQAPSSLPNESESFPSSQRQGTSPSGNEHARTEPSGSDRVADRDKSPVQPSAKAQSEAWKAFQTSAGGSNPASEATKPDADVACYEA